MPLRRLLVSLSAALALALVPDARAQGLLAQDASVQPIDVPVENVEWPQVDHTDAGPVQGTAQWRVVEQTGNCCENYLASTAGGRLLDFGGTYLNFSDDAGETWFRVDPGRPMLGGEGAVVTAPNGDVLGVGWDVYSGDTLFAVKYEAATGAWRWQTMPLHTPFYDREWIGVVPGPFTLPGVGTVPWVSFVRGGYPSKEAWLYSTDGLSYTSASSKFLESTVNRPVDSPLVPTLGPMADEIQGNTNMGLMPLGGGRALAAPEVPFGEWTYLNPETLTWSPYTFPGERAAGVYQSDSSGRLHNVVRRDEDTGFDYRVSADGGVTWKATGISLPANHEIEEIDARVSGADGVGVVAIHAHDSSDDQDQDLLYKLDTGTGRPVLMRRYDIGRGDVDGTSGVQETGNRFDFDTITLLPGGRVAMSFYDAGTEGTPAVAIERSEPLPATRPTTSSPPLGGPEAPPAATTDVTGPSGRAHRVTLRVRRRSGRLVFSGAVRPPHPGHRVVIQRIRRGKVTRVTVMRAGKRSRFRAVLRLRVRRSDRFRAVVDRDAAGHLRGVSVARKAR